MYVLNFTSHCRWILWLVQNHYSRKFQSNERLHDSLDFTYIRNSQLNHLKSIQDWESLQERLSQSTSILIIRLIHRIRNDKYSDTHGHTFHNLDSGWYSDRNFIVEYKCSLCFWRILQSGTNETIYNTLLININTQ